MNKIASKTAKNKKRNLMSPNKDFLVIIERLLLIVFGMGIDYFHIFHILADF